jgi:hypothetical protein
MINIEIIKLVLILNFSFKVTPSETRGFLFKGFFMAAYDIVIFKELMKFLDTTLDSFVVSNIPNFINGIAPIASAAFALVVLTVLVAYWSNNDLIGNYMDLIKKMD